MTEPYINLGRCTCRGTRRRLVIVTLHLGRDVIGVSSYFAECVCVQRVEPPVLLNHHEAQS